MPPLYLARYADSIGGATCVLAFELDEDLDFLRATPALRTLLEDAIAPRSGLTAMMVQSFGGRRVVALQGSESAVLSAYGLRREELSGVWTPLGSRAALDLALAACPGWVVPPLAHEMRGVAVPRYDEIDGLLPPLAPLDGIENFLAIFAPLSFTARAMLEIQSNSLRARDLPFPERVRARMDRSMGEPMTNRIACLLLRKPSLNLGDSGSRGAAGGSGPSEEETLEPLLYDADVLFPCWPHDAFFASRSAGEAGTQMASWFPIPDREWRRGLSQRFQTAISAFERSPPYAPIAAALAATAVLDSSQGMVERLVTVRALGETLARQMYVERTGKPAPKNFNDMLNTLQNPQVGGLPATIANRLHFLRLLGNQAAHIDLMNPSELTSADLEEMRRDLLYVAEWFLREFVAR